MAMVSPVAGAVVNRLSVDAGLTVTVMGIVVKALSRKTTGAVPFAKPLMDKYPERVAYVDLDYAPPTDVDTPNDLATLR